MLEWVERLREMDDQLISLGNGQYANDHRHNTIADEIEREIAERYMELPVDMDGVPIKPGHRIEFCGDIGEVWLVGTSEIMTNSGRSALACAANHYVKPRTIEDVLREFIVAFDEWDTFAETGREKARDELFAMYADELRGMGVGE